jgi:hypothetical protein
VQPRRLETERAEGEAERKVLEETRDVDEAVGRPSANNMLMRAEGTHSVETRSSTPATRTSTLERTAPSAVSRPGRRPPTSDVAGVWPSVDTAVVTSPTMLATRAATSAELWRRASGETALSALSDVAQAVRCVSISVISGAVVEIVVLLLSRNSASRQRLHTPEQKVTTY